MRYTVILAILALGLVGCNLNGVSYDLSGLPNLNIDEVNCNNCNVNVNIADSDQQKVENHYFVEEKRWYLGQNPDYVLSRSSSWGTDHKWYYGSKESTDKIYGNVSRRVNVDGDSGLFVEYNFNPNTPKHLNDQHYRDRVENYMIAGGNIEQNYTPMPSGNYHFSGIVVAKPYYFVDHTKVTYSNGTVNAEANFTDNVLSIEFNGTGTGIDRRFEDIEIDVETGEFYSKEESPDYETIVSGDFIGTEAKSMFGFVSYEPDADAPLTEIDMKGMFVAERSDKPVVAEN